MPEAELCLLFVRPLNRLGVRYIVSGSVAAILREGGSDKHLWDIRSMLAVSGDQLDRPALDEWIRLRGLEPQWKRALDET